MPILDQNNIYFEKQPLAATAANSDPVYVMPFIGNGEPVNITGFVEGAAAGAGVTVVVQESDDKTAWKSLATYNFDESAVAGGILCLRLPPETSKRYTRLQVSASAAGGSITLGVTRDHPAMYAKGLYINAGRVEA